MCISWHRQFAYFEFFPYDPYALRWMSVMSQAIEHSWSHIMILILILYIISLNLQKSLAKSRCALVALTAIFIWIFSLFPMGFFNISVSSQAIEHNCTLKIMLVPEEFIISLNIKNKLVKFGCLQNWHTFCAQNAHVWMLKEASKRHQKWLHLASL